jgi:hypothetical protein
MITIEGNAGTVAEVDGTTFRALRVTPRPVNYGTSGIYRIGARTGTLAASLGANSEFFQFRWTSTSAFALVTRIGLSAAAATASTAGSSTVPFLVLSRFSSWSSVGAGGTVITPTSDTCKLRTSMATSVVGTVKIATTTTLGAGTKTADNAECGAVYMGLGLGALTTTVSTQLIAPFWIFDSEEEANMPLVFRANQGFAIRVGNVGFPAGMTWALSVNVAWAEVSAF